MRVLGAIVLLAMWTGPALAGEDIREIDTYQKTQGNKDYRDYLRWKREQDYTERMDRRDNRPIVGACKGWYEQEGTKMISTYLAKGSAIKAWERAVRVKENEEYADWNFGGGKRVGQSGPGFRCWNVGGFVRCEARAMACRPS